jgi:hypothetical protein
MPTQCGAQEPACQYCGNPITRGRFCSPECSQLWYLEQNAADRDEKPVEVLEPVLRCYEGFRWQVVGMHVKNLTNNA